MLIVLPPSSDRYSATLGTYTTSELLGSIVGWLKYQPRPVNRESPFASTHVFPPSSERYRPDCLPASMSAYTRRPFADTVTPTRPQSPSGSPLPFNCVQFAPASLLRNRPPPGPSKGAYVLHGGRCACHVPANSVPALPAAIARSLAPISGPRSSTCVHVVPP